MGVARTIRGVGGARPAESLLRRNVKRFRGGLVFKAHRLVYHSNHGLRVIKKKRSLGFARAVRGVFFFSSLLLKPQVERYKRL